MKKRSTDELLHAFKEIERLRIISVRNTSAEFAVKRLEEACAIAKAAIAKIENNEND